MQNNIIFHQLFEKESSTYTYLIGDPISMEAVIIDPVAEMLDRDFKLLGELGLNLKYILETHVHADHITSSGELRKKTGAKVGLSSAYDLSCCDLHLEDSQELKIGNIVIKTFHTPGHTSGCLSYQINNMVFTGDALLVRGCGRTDFQEGSSEKLYGSIHEKLFTLPDETVIFPGHDYKGFTHSDIGIEKKLNPRLNLSITKEKFVEIMANLKLALPAKIHEAVPANIQCGLKMNMAPLTTDLVGGVPTLTAEEVLSRISQFKVIDVRGEDEFNNELGHIISAELSTLGENLLHHLSNDDKKRQIVFVCRSGKRSAEATKIALSKGFENVFNMEGGMLRWKELNFPFQRDMGGS